MSILSGGSVSALRAAPPGALRGWVGQAPTLILIFFLK